MLGYVQQPTTDCIAIFDGSRTRWLTPQGASCRRILSQDQTAILQWCVEHGVDDFLRFTLFTQLAQVCGVALNDQDLFVQEGHQLSQRSPFVGYDEQLRWLLTDLSARESIQARDAASSGLQTRLVSRTIYEQATALRMEINLHHIEKLQQMLNRQPLAQVARIRNAMPVGNSAAPTSGYAPPRNPLREASRNKWSRSSTSPMQSNKRKRKNSVSTAQVPATQTQRDSDDEETLQGEADALESRIAAIRAKKTRDDDLMPLKRTTTARKAPRRAPPLPSAVTTTAASIDEDAPHDRKRAEIRRTYSPSRNKNTRMANHLPGQPMKVDLSALGTVKLILQRDRKPNCGLEVPPNTSMKSIATVAKNEFGIPTGQAVCLHFEGLRLSAAETVFEAQLHHYDVLEVFDLPPLKPCPTIAPEANLTKLKSRSTEPLEVARPCSDKPLATRAAVNLTSSSSLQIIAQPATYQPAVPPLPVQGEPVLCREQQEVVDLIVAGHNVFYTGSAGCGKSTVLKAFTACLRDRGKTVKIVAPTGKAALDINGSTTWTFAGWTPGHMKKPLKDLITAAHGKFVSKRFQSTDVLVIDEISMVENHLLARLNHIMKAARGSDKPFGGVQLVVTGDFCQLPPVKPFQYCMICGREQNRIIGDNGETLYRCSQHGDCNDDDKWAFRSKAWEECEFKHVNLTNIHRQSDSVFIGILQKLRIGVPLSNVDRQLLLNHPCDVKNAVKLFPTREEVRRINQTEFNRLNTAKRDYRCLDYFRWNEEHGNLREKGRRSPVDNSLEALREHRLENLVSFKANMLVVLLVNLDIANGLVNGSQGRVIGFEPYAESKLPKAALREGDSVASSSRSGGSRKPRRGRDASPQPSQTIVQGELRGEYASLREGQIKDFIMQPCNQEKRWPIVEFDNGIRRTIYADCQVNEFGDEKPYTLMARTQIPLLAAWAMTIHKSQGMTLNKVIVDLGRSFEEGQEYVALSRARSLDGLQVTSLGSKVGTGGNEQVKKWLKEKFNIG